VKGREVSFADGRLDFAPIRRDLPIYVASQRAGGCRVAGRLADGAIMQGAVADPLVRFFRETVHGGAREAGRDPARIALVARLNVCVADDRAAARDIMRPGLVRSLSAQRPDFFTFVTAGLALPAALRNKVMALPYTHDPEPLRAVAPEVPDAFVDAVTLTGPPDAIAPKSFVSPAAVSLKSWCTRLRSTDGSRRRSNASRAEVMPRVRAALA
jgi:5,10-methylenetetrahydromethanopterin reductase